MKEFRCHNCNNVLYKTDDTVDVEMVCPLCRRVNYPNRTDSGMGLRGKDFQAKAIDHNCYRCQRLVMRSIGLGIVETKCFPCWKLGFKDLLTFDTKLMREGRWVAPKPTDEYFIERKKSLAR